MKKYAVIVAGGTGTRMGSKLPKQFLLLEGKPVLWHTIETFLAAYPDLEIILVIPVHYVEEATALVQKTSNAERIVVTTGGETRFHSVRNGLSLVTQPSIVFVHDGVRCLVSQHLVRSCYTQALAKGNAIPCIAVSDSVRMITENGHQPVDRNRLRAIQTPQTFKSDILLKSFELPYSETFTDEATVAEAAGYEVFLTEGEKENIKITLPADIPVAEQILRSRPSC